MRKHGARGVFASLLVVASILLASCEPPVDPDDGETIGLVKLVSPEAQLDDWFGFSVAIDGEYAVVGAYYEDGGPGDPRENAGAVYVFHRANGSWDTGTRLVAPDAEAYDVFGYSVAISGEYVVVGAYGEDGATGSLAFAGAAYVFHRTGTAWDTGTKLVAPDAQAGDTFGVSASINGDYLVVGAKNENGGPGDPLSQAGAAYVFHRTGVDAWDAGTRIAAPDPQVQDWFGCSVAISGDYLVVGAYREDGGAGDPRPEAGAAYVFHRTVGGWGAGSKITASDTEYDDYFGFTVSMSGDDIVVGARGEDDGTGIPLDAAGAAYLFRQTAPDVWEEVGKIVAPDAEAEDYFGYSVSISGDSLAVGAYGEDGGAGDPLDLAGAAYIFQRTGTTWDTGTRIVAPDAEAGDRFGTSVSISGSEALIGAYLEDGETGNPLGSTGAAYVCTGY